MNTKASILIHGWENSVWLLYNCNGHPSDLGPDLVDLLRIYEYENTLGEKKWQPSKIADFITERDLEYKNADSYSQDSEYIYVIDSDIKRLFCYKHEKNSVFDALCPGDPLEIPDNLFDGRQRSQEALDKSSVSFCDMFKSLPGLPESLIQYKDTSDGKMARTEIFNTALGGILEKWSISDITRNPDAELNYIVSIAKSLTDKALKALSR